MTPLPIRHRRHYADRLIIVISILALLCIGAMFLPLIDRDKGAESDDGSRYIRLSKAQALRDSAARSGSSGSNDPTGTKCNAIQYIEQLTDRTARTVTVNNTALKIAVLISTRANPVIPPGIQAPPPYPNPMLATAIVLVDGDEPASQAGWDPADPESGKRLSGIEPEPALSRGFCPESASHSELIRDRLQFPGFGRCMITLDAVEGTDITPSCCTTASA